MPFTSQHEAKQFLAGKIIEQAVRDGEPLSDDDQRMLFCSVDEPETMEGFPENVSMDEDEAYEKKITALLKAAYARDKDTPGEGQNYKDAYGKLAEGDHYISVMAGPVLGGGRLAGSEMSLRNIFVAVAIAVGVMIFAAIIWAWSVSPRS